MAGEVKILDLTRGDFCPRSTYKERVKTEPIGYFECWLRKQMANKNSDTYKDITDLTRQYQAGHTVLLTCRCNPTECEGGKVARAVELTERMSAAWGSVDNWIDNGPQYDK